MGRARIACLLLAAGLVGIGVARADQNDPRLGTLFEVLKAASNPLEGYVVERQIWQIWLAAEDPEVDRLMAAGIAAMGVGKYADALQAFDRVVELAPDFAEGWNKRATVLYLMQDFEASMADVARTLALEPRHFGALSGLGLIEIEREHEEQALDAFERALAIYPQMTGPRANAEYLRKRIQDRSI